MATTIHSLAYKITADTAGMTKGLAATKKELRAAKQQMLDMETPLERFKRKVQESAIMLDKGLISQETHKRKLQQLSNEYRKASGEVKGFGASLGGVGKLLAAGAVIEGFRRIGKANLDFQKAMARSTAIMSGVTEELRVELEQTAKSIATDTVFSAKEAPEAYFFLASAGLNAEKSLKSLSTVAEFAQAGTFDLATATDLLTDAQTGLGLASEDTTKNLKNMRRVSDALVKANTISNATIQEFSEALTNKAAASMRAYSVSMEDGLSVLAVLASQGFAKGAKAGTALSAVIRDLTQKSQQNASAFKKWKVDVFNAETGAFQLVTAIEKIETAISGLTDKQKTQALLELGFTSESADVLKAVLGQTGQLKAFREQFEGIDGLTGDIAEKNIPALEKALNRLSASFEKFSTSPAVTKGLEQLASGLTAVTDVLDSFSKVGDVGDKFNAFVDSYSKLLIKLASGASLEPLFGGTAISEGAEGLRQRAGRAVVGTPRGDKGVDDVAQQVEQSRRDARKNTADIVAGLNRIENATRQTGVAVENPPGSRGP